VKLRAATLAAWLGLDAAWVSLVALGGYAGGLPARVLESEPGSRAVGLAYAGLGWVTLVRARGLSTGLRRLLASAGALGLCAAGSLRLGGSLATDTVSVWVGPAWQGPGVTALGALALWALAGYAWATSPLRR
jgi:hypothetical protein